MEEKPSNYFERDSVAAHFIARENSKVINLKNPYVIERKTEEEKEIEKLHNELDIRLEGYEEIARMNASIKKWLIIGNLIIIPLLLGVIFALYSSGSHNTPSLADFFAIFTLNK